MNSSETPPPAPPDPVSARACLATNLMVFPGLGTRLAGRPGAWAQMVLAAVGFAALTAWGLSVGIAWALQGEPGWGEPPWTWVGLAGFSLSAASWGWSLASGLAVLRDAKRAEQGRTALPPRAR